MGFNVLEHHSQLFLKDVDSPLIPKVISCLQRVVYKDIFDYGILSMLEVIVKVPDSSLWNHLALVMTSQRTLIKVILTVLL